MSLLTTNIDEPLRATSGSERSYGRTLRISALLLLPMLAMAGPFATMNPDTPSSSDGNPLRQISYILLFAFAWWKFKGTNRSAFFAVPLSIILTLGWCCLSLSWAIEPEIASRRLILTTVIIWTAFLAVRQTRYEETLVDIRYAMLFGLIANYAAVIALPQFGIHHVLEKGGDYDLIGNWRGVLLQKNFAGALCALTIIFYLFDGSKMRATARFLVICAAAYFLYRTHSKTSMGLLVVSLAVGSAYLMYNPRYRVGLFVATGVAVVLALMYAYVHFDALVAPFDSQEAFTGRGSIWPVTFHYWRDHWLGSGYGSFWVIGYDSPAYRYGAGWVTEVGNGHNGYLDLLAEIGTPGLILTVFSFILWPLFKVLSSREIVRRRGALLIAALFFCAGHNFTESSLLDRDMIVQVFLVLTLAMICVATQRKAHGSSEGYRHRLVPQGRPEPSGTIVRPRPAAAATGRALVSVEPKYEVEKLG